ncbi:MAG: NADH:ubiquinone reductase (Na(+)-transporting) subunit F [Luteitalea sp.]
MHTTRTRSETEAEEARRKDYSLVGADTRLAIARGLAEADWYVSPVAKDTLKDLLERRDGPALRDCAIYFGLILVTGIATVQLWGSWWAVVPMMVYGVLYASASDARWHEAGHGTAFRTDWLNNALYEVASFMVLRESVPWRWSHTRHHSDTIIVGRDPEIAVPRPPDLPAMLLKCVNYRAFRRYVSNITLHSLGRITAEEATFIPVSEYGRVFLRARIYLAVFLTMLALCVYGRTWLPFVFVLGPNLYGAWLMAVYGWTQHAGLAENVLDHRLNCRTIHMNAVHRFLYWNMNYHLEHHMFPMVPYHQLPRLHEIVKQDCPAPYPSLTAAYREIVPAVLRQIRDPGYFVRRTLPPTARPVGARPRGPVMTSRSPAAVNDWVDVCASGVLERNDVLRFDHDRQTYAIYRTGDGTVRATDGMCTHGNTHLADGLVTGTIVECPKHNGRFDVTTGEPRRLPACIALRTHEAKVEAGRIWLRPRTGVTGHTYELQVVSNRNVATFVRELVLAPRGADVPSFQPGQYMQLRIPAYDRIQCRDFVVDEPYAAVWRAHHLFDLEASNPIDVRRNYSLANDPAGARRELRFNVRMAVPPQGLDCGAGVGSSYVHALEPGDTVTATGPFGDFLIRDGEREMIYVGGGAGMAPIRSHLLHLFDTLRTGRQVSYWYGARSRQEIFYEDDFRALELRWPNFRFHLALSAPLPGDDWTGHAGFIHDVLRREHLARHPDPSSAEYYLCGPPMMIQSARSMLIGEFDVAPRDIAFDEF